MQSEVAVINIPSRNARRFLMYISLSEPNLAAEFRGFALSKFRQINKYNIWKNVPKQFALDTL